MKPSPPARLLVDEYAFFLDLDGTLIDLAPRPAQVRGDPELLALLRVLSVRSRGAMALVSGRPIADLDNITAPERFPVSGLHGFELRDAKGVCSRQAPPSSSKIEEVRAALGRLAITHPQLLLEDKGFALALHYRQAPHLANLVASAVRMIPDLSASGLRVQQGHMVVEVTPYAADKATALAYFMREPPFRGRSPLYIGDDLTDESAFQWVNQAGGLSVAVNAHAFTTARASLSSVAAVRWWLHELVEDVR